MLEGHSSEDTNASPFYNFANNFSEKKSQSETHNHTFFLSARNERIYGYIVSDYM